MKHGVDDPGTVHGDFLCVLREGWVVTPSARRRICILLGLGSALAACQPPSRPTPSRQTVSPPQTLALPSPSTAQRRAEEARWLVAFPDVGVRRGDTLIIRHDGRDVARYSDDALGCNPYSISKVIRLYDAASGALQPIAELNCHFGAQDNRYLVLPSSDKYTVVDDVAASPDGRTLAMADNSLAQEGGQFSLIAWPSMARIATFKAGCRNVLWKDADHLTALCWSNNGSSPQDADDTRSFFFTAEIGRDDGGRWTMTATGFVDGGSEKPVPAAGRPLPHLDGETLPPDRP